MFLIYAVIFSDARVWSLPCSRFIQSFFRLKAMASRNSSERIFAFPLVSNLRKPKSFFSRPKAPSTWMERHRRRWMLRSDVIRCAAWARFSQKVFCKTRVFGCSVKRGHILSQISHKVYVFSCPQSYTALGRKYHMDPRTAKRYAESPERPEYMQSEPKPTKLDAYKQIVDEWLEEVLSSVTVLKSSPTFSNTNP